MNPLDIITTALRSLGSSKLRSGLTLLGIIIGITGVSVMMSIGRGVQDAITSQIQSQGANLLFVYPAYGERGEPSLTLQDAEALNDPVLAPSVSAVAPEINTYSHIVAGRKNTGAEIVGVTSDYAVVRNLSIDKGQFISRAHTRNNSEVAVLSASVVKDIFSARANPVGERIRIGGRQFKVIGVLEDKGASFFGGRDQVFVPITTAYYRLTHSRTTQGAIRVDMINAQAASSEVVNDAKLEIAAILRLRHRISDRNDFEIETLQELLDSLNQIITIMVLFLGSVAGISLLVGGIGVMNIMLVSVTERTREIGIRKAMGAKRRDILLQFITEAVFLTLSGGIIGLLLNLALSPLINLIVNSIDDSGSLSTSGIAFHPDVALLALSVSAIVGLLSGIYPALRAARMHPIDALRYE